MNLLRLYIKCPVGLILTIIVSSFSIASCSSPQERMISSAKKNKEIELVGLIKSGVDPNYSSKNDNKTALQIASDLGYLGLVNQLIKLGADVNKRGAFDSYTPLMHACERGHIDIAKLLIDNGANVIEPREKMRIERNFYQTPLGVAARAGSYEIAEELLKRGAKVNTKTYYSVYRGWTPLMFAAKNDHKEIVSLLLKNKASVDDHDERTLQTALFHAVLSENLGMVEMLIAAGANVKHLDAKRYTAEHYAEYEVSDKDLRGLLLTRLRDAGTERFRLSVFKDSVIMKNGRSLNGVKVSLTDSSVVIVWPDGRSEVYKKVLVSSVKRGDSN